MTATTTTSASGREPAPDGGIGPRTEAAWIIDPARALLVWASAEGAELWGLARAGSQHEPLDRAMPALAELARIAAKGATAVPGSVGSLTTGALSTTTAPDDARRLAFWTRRGALAVPCRLRSIGSDVPERAGGVAIIPCGVARSEEAAASAAERSRSSRRNDVETLKEIARRIREGRPGEPAAPSSPPDMSPLGPSPVDPSPMGPSVALSDAGARDRPEKLPRSSTNGARLETASAAGGGHRSEGDFPLVHLASPANDTETAVKPIQETLATLSHEVRTPLAAIAGLAEVLREEVFGPLGDDRYREYATDIVAAARHALDVVDATLARGAVGSGGSSGHGRAGESGTGGTSEWGACDADPDGYVTEFAVDPAIEECVAIMAPLARSRAVTLLHERRPAVPHVIADRRALKQVMLNLMANAVRATPRGGVVAVGSLPGDGGQRLDVEIVDTGPGMSPEEIARALGEGASRRASNSAPDPQAGLGLTIARTLAAANGCQIALEPRLEGGLIARLSIPAGRLLPV